MRQLKGHGMENGIADLVTYPSQARVEKRMRDLSIASDERSRPAGDDISVNHEPQFQGKVHEAKVLIELSICLTRTKRQWRIASVQSSHKMPCML